jgi:hypothetical protein
LALIRIRYEYAATSQFMSCRMLAEIARRRSRGSIFETRVLVMPRRSFSWFFSRSSPPCILFDSCVMSALETPQLVPIYGPRCTLMRVSVTEFCSPEQLEHRRSGLGC